MKKLLFFSTLIAAFFSSASAQRTCGTMDYLAKQLLADPSFAAKRAEIEAQTQAYQNNGNKVNVVYTIPVVVHVVYNNGTQNISDAQIQTQLTVLNQDFRRANADAANTPAAFAGLAADCEINFCLATLDPSGAATTGITRTSTATTSFADDDAVKFNASGGHDVWDRTKYLNLWVCNLSGTLLGYAQFPGGPASTDGVVIDYQYFGTIGTATAPFNKGRTATHEVGHWLNLYHIWGDDSDGNGTCGAGECSGTDAVTDTPNQCEENYGCPTFPRTDGCTAGNGVMFMDYMDYTDDACMNMYTTGQKTRMQSVLAAGGSRASLATSPGCGTPGGYCTSAGSSTADEWIATVAIGAFSNTSGNNGGYGNYTLQNINLTKGVATSFTLTPGYTGTAYPEYWKIWVDLNHDFDFADAGEMLYDAGTTSTSPRTGTITAPLTATATVTRMRVSMKYNGAQTACETFSYGEVEDYQVTLLTAPSCGNPSGLSAGSITSTTATLSWTAVAGATSYNIQYKVNGGPTWTTTTSATNSKALSGLTASTTYNWQVQAVCGGTTSSYVAGSNFTTSAAGCTDAYESNNTSATAPAISVNTNVLAKICDGTDIDWFKFTTTTGAPKVKITLTTLPADYDVILYASNATTQLGISQNGGTTSETIIYNTATVGATYYVKVYGYNGAFNISTSYTLRASAQAANWRLSGPLETTPKTPMFVSQDYLQVFPNPTSENLFVNYFSEEGGSAKLTLVNMLGEIVMERNLQLEVGVNNSILEVTGLAKGLYFIRVETNKEFRTEKVQVN